MGAGKFPEQIVERRDLGLQEAADADKPDAIIERMKAKRVRRTINAEEKNCVRPQQAGIRKSSRTVARRLALTLKLNAVYHKIDVLRNSDNNEASAMKTNSEQIGQLEKYAKYLRSLQKRKRNPNKVRR